MTTLFRPVCLNWPKNLISSKLKYIFNFLGNFLHFYYFICNNKNLLNSNENYSNFSLFSLLESNHALELKLLPSEY